VGEESGGALTTGAANAFFGYHSGRRLTTGSGNVCLGSTDAGGWITSGNYNVCIGYEAAGASGASGLTSGSNNILIGKGATSSSQGVSNQITLGNSDITKFRIPGVGLEATDNGISTDGVFIENAQAVTADYTITNGKNAGSFGPITINSGITVTIGAGETWTVI
jgi:hypothetical protein